MAIVNILGVPHAYNLTAPTASPFVLVFIHGWLLSNRYWQPLIAQLAPDYQCLSYDLRGFGDSQPLNGSKLNGEEITADLPLEASVTSKYSPAAYAEDLSVLLEKLHISNAWLIGHSLGGSIALWGADRMPDCVKGVICLNSGGGIYLQAAFERFRSAGQQMLKRRPRWLCSIPGIDLLFTRAQVARPIARQWGRQRLIDFVTAHPEAALGSLLDSTTEEEVYRLPPLVARLKQPVYFIAGAKDTVMEPKYVRHLASFHPLFQNFEANVIEIPDCGHMAMVEATDAAATHIRNIVSG